MFSHLTPITRNIIILNVLVYLFSNLISQELAYANFSGFFPTSPYFKSWQVISHMFMHGGIMHIAFNLLTFASFGPILERFLGDKKFIVLYFFSGFGSFFLFNLWELIKVYELAQPLLVQGFSFSELLGGNFGEVPNSLYHNAKGIAEILSTPMVGASGAIFGVLAAFATLYPNTEMFLLFIPFPIKAKVLFPIVII